MVEDQTMLPISDLAQLSLAWKQPSAWRREYHLVSDSGQHGWLAFTSAWRETAEAEIGGQRWTFNRSGFFKRQVLIAHAQEAEPFAVYYPHTWRTGGKLELGSAGYEFSSNFWMTRFEVWGAGDQPLVTFHKGGFFRMTVGVEIEPGASRLPELPLLVALGLYIILLHERDAGAAAAATTAC
jgi:hypothetical protein